MHATCRGGTAPGRKAALGYFPNHKWTLQPFAAQNAARLPGTPPTDHGRLRADGSRGHCPVRNRRGDDRDKRHRAACVCGCGGGGGEGLGKRSTLHACCWPAHQLARSFIPQWESSQFPLHVEPILKVGFCEFAKCQLRGIPMTYQWRTSGLPMAYQWPIDGTPMAHQWRTDGLSMAYQWPESWEARAALFAA